MSKSNESGAYQQHHLLNDVYRYASLLYSMRCINTLYETGYNRSLIH